MHRHSSFLLRCWNLGSQDERIEIKHVQSGTKTLVRSVPAVVEWICGRDTRCVTQQGEGERMGDDHE